MAQAAGAETEGEAKARAEAVKITVPTDSGFSREIDALPTKVPALVITRALDEDGWKITHTRTGFAISKKPFESQREAEMAAAKLGDLDWDFGLEGLPHDADALPYKQRIRAARKEVEAELAGG